MKASIIIIGFNSHFTSNNKFSKNKGEHRIYERSKRFINNKYVHPPPSVVEL